MRYTPDNITELAPGEIFVFGSNEQGIHGAGAAKQAAKSFGARRGVGEGICGSSYAIPTKRTPYNTLTLDQIKPYVDQFIEYAKNNPQFNFLVTQIGCGYAGYTPGGIAPLFVDAIGLENVVLPEVFHKVLWQVALKKYHDSPLYIMRHDMPEEGESNPI